MDLALYARVLWRFRFLVATGFVIAVLLSVLAAAKVSFAGGTPHLSYRKAEVWQSQASLLITQHGFPYGRSTAPSNTASFPGLVALYVKFVNSDAVQSRLGLTPEQTVQGVPVLDSSGGALPILGIVGTASSAGNARALADHATAVFKHYLDEQQSSAGIPPVQRIVLQEVNAAARPVLVVGHKKTLPILAFLTVMIATIGVAFILENLRPQARTVKTETAPGGAEPELLKKSA
jgi:hypothetical protein